MTVNSDIEMRSLFKTLVGSHNYNLSVDEMIFGNTGITFPKSDKDFKMFILPTYEDLYKGEMYSDKIIGDEEDYDIHDIRKLPQLFWKANLNFLEILFSNKILISDRLSPEQREFIMKIFNRRDEIVKMNLPYLFNACGGMYINKMKALPKGTEGTQHLMDLFGYDTKSALHAYRVMNFIVRFANNEFNDFKKVMTYTDEERKILLAIKHGYFKMEEFESFAEKYHTDNFQPLKEKYHSFEPNEKLKNEIEEIIMELVRISL